MMLDYNGGMMWGANDGGSWLWMAAMMILVVAVIAALAVFAIRASTGPKSTDQAMNVLRQRLASGEIAQEEFEKTRKTLQA